MNPQEFIDQLCALEFENTFNPYSNHCGTYDVENASFIRRNILLAILKIAEKKEVDSIWIGRDLGHRGGRRCGLALTDDAHIQEHAARWGLKIDNPTKGEIIQERTAAIIWKVLSQIDSRVFLWNVFPLHPHEPGKPFSNRSHNVIERSAGQELLINLIKIINPKRIIAIGNDAEKITTKIVPNMNIVKVRHPSYGGQKQFTDSMYDLYSLPKK